jgi:hypothetical protein
MTAYRITLLASLLPSICVVAQPTAATKGKAPTRITSAYLRGPFVQADPTSLGPGFLGHDIKAVVASLSKSVPEKSEFETTEQFADRLASVQIQKQYIFVNDPATDAHPIDDYSSAGAFEYDADVQAFKRTVTMFYFDGRFAVRTIRMAAGQFVASNAFGVRTTVSRFEKTVYELQIKESSPFFEKGGPNETLVLINLTVPMEVATAAAAKSHLRLALLCTLTSMEVQRDDSVDDATIDHPVELHWHERILPVRIDRIFVFDNRTGRILTVVE